MRLRWVGHGLGKVVSWLRLRLRLRLRLQNINTHLISQPRPAPSPTRATQPKAKTDSLTPSATLPRGTPRRRHPPAALWHSPGGPQIILADMEFSPMDSAAERHLKLQVRVGVGY